MKTPVYDAMMKKNKDFIRDEGNIEVIRKLQEAFRNNERLAAWKEKRAKFGTQLTLV